MISKKDLERINTIVSHWGLSTYTVQGIDDKYNVAEALLHEVCHGVAFNLRITRSLPKRTQNRFEALNSHNNIFGLVYEAQTLAIESHALKILGWQRKVRMRMVVQSTWRNGTAGSALPLTMYFAIYRKFLCDPTTGVQAHAVIRHFVRLVGRSLRKP